MFILISSLVVVTGCIALVAKYSEGIFTIPEDAYLFDIVSENKRIQKIGRKS